MNYTTTVPSLALKSGLSPRQIRQEIELGHLKALKAGRDWIISSHAVEEWEKIRRGPGRPRK